MEIFLGVSTAISPLLALGGVWLGARLAGRQEGSRWLRDQRQETYVEYLDLLIALTKVFGVGMRVTKFGGQAAVDPGHDVAGVEDSFSEIMDDLQHLEQRLELINDSDVSEVRQEIDDVILRMMDSSDDEKVTEDHWNEIQAESWDLLSRLQKATFW